MSSPPDPHLDRTGGADPIEPALDPPDRTPPSRRRMLLAVAVLALVLDVGSKAIVVATLSDREPLRLFGGLLYLTEARNTGAAFSFAPGATMVFTVIAIVVVALILRTAGRVRTPGWALALGLILGGAAGNLIDRLFRDPGVFRGAVIDFLSLLDPYGRFYPIFNLADSAIVCGGVLAVLLALRGVDLDGTRVRRRS